MINKSHHFLRKNFHSLFKKKHLLKLTSGLSLITTMCTIDEKMECFFFIKFLVLPCIVFLSSLMVYILIFHMRPNTTSSYNAFIDSGGLRSYIDFY